MEDKLSMSGSYTHNSRKRKRKHRSNRESTNYVDDDDDDKKKKRSRHDRRHKHKKHKHKKHKHRDRKSRHKQQTTVSNNSSIAGGCDDTNVTIGGDKSSSEEPTINCNAHHTYQESKQPCKTKQPLLLSSVSTENKLSQHLDQKTATTINSQPNITNNSLNFVQQTNKMKFGITNQSTDMQQTPLATDISSSKIEEQQEVDMFADGDDDDFSSTQIEHRQEEISNDAKVIDTYFVMEAGEMLAKKYTLLNTLGKGAFSTVVKATTASSLNADAQNRNCLFAIKISKSSRNFRFAALVEKEILFSIKNYVAKQGHENSNNNNSSFGSLMNSDCISNSRQSLSTKHAVSSPALLLNGAKQVVTSLPLLNATATTAETTKKPKRSQWEVDKKRNNYIISIFDFFEHKNHSCLVLEAMSCNLRELMQEFSKNTIKGIRNLAVIKIYARQLLVALNTLHKYTSDTIKYGILHADIKLDNILVSENKKYVKLADFGTAFYVDHNLQKQNDGNVELVARYYRAPEIILGMQCDRPIDVWALGCSLVELLTGKVLFPGKNNNDMLFLMQLTLGSFAPSIVDNAPNRHTHFTANYQFLHKHEPIKQFSKCKCNSLDSKFQPRLAEKLADLLAHSRTNRAHCVQSMPSLQPSTQRSLLDEEQLFCDFVSELLQLDASKRITAAQALYHPFLQNLRLSLFGCKTGSFNGYLMVGDVRIFFVIG